MGQPNKIKRLRFVQTYLFKVPHEGLGYLSLDQENCLYEVSSEGLDYLTLTKDLPLRSLAEKTNLYEVSHERLDYLSFSWITRLSRSHLRELLLRSLVLGTWLSMSRSRTSTLWSLFRGTWLYKSRLRNLSVSGSPENKLPPLGLNHFSLFKVSCVRECGLR